MLFEIELRNRAVFDFFLECEKSLQRFGETVFIDRTGGEITRSPDGYLSVTSAGGVQTRYVCEAKKKIGIDSLGPVTARLREWEITTKARPLLIATHVSDVLGDRLRATGIQYIDLSGNIFLVDQSCYIWLQGFKAREQPDKATRAFQATGLQLIALLLSQPEAVNKSYRQLADEAGLSLGSISRILGDLRGLGFIRLVAPGLSAIVNGRSLMEHWEFGYATRLRPRLKPQTFRQADVLPIDQLPERIPLQMRDEVLIGGELAAAIETRTLRPETATFHVPPHLPIFPLIKEMKLIPDKGGNIVLIEQFGKASEWRWPQRENRGLAHPLLIYAELIQGNPDDRLLEVAKLIFNEQLAPVLDHEPATIPK